MRAAREGDLCELFEPNVMRHAGHLDIAQFLRREEDKRVRASPKES
ncbi:MAG TPA: hypothetical protein VGH90_05740 [Chthoniobacteraceae bacterium]